MSVLPCTLPAAALPAGPHIETNGIGIVEVAPDMATLVISVNTSAKKSVEAKKQADERVAQYFALLEKMAIDKRDINAANVTTHAEYDYSKGGSPKLVGYKANRVVTVKLHQLDKLNLLLDSALAAQLNEISSIQLGVANEVLYKQQARKKAMENATELATSLAQGFNAKLGLIYRISYQTSDLPIGPTPVMARAKSAAMLNSAYSADATYTQESIKFQDSVNVVFELSR